uniref:Uncharacterized protein n=1 Tax=Cacopsylla melanoneura TaxID=428564 RepID=A0A8D8Q5Q4_9HEMI
MNAGSCWDKCVQWSDIICKCNKPEHTCQAPSKLNGHAPTNGHVQNGDVTHRHLNGHATRPDDKQSTLSRKCVSDPNSTLKTPSKANLTSKLDASETHGSWPPFHP